MKNITLEKIIAIVTLLVMTTVFTIVMCSIDFSIPEASTPIEESNISIPEIDNSIIIEIVSESSEEEIVEESYESIEETSELSEEDPVRGPMSVETIEPPETIPINPIPEAQFVYYTHYYHPNSNNYPDPIPVKLSYNNQVIAYNLCQKYQVPFEVMLGLWEKETTFNINIGHKWGGESDPAWYCGIGMLSEEHCYYPLKLKYNVNIHTPLGGLEGSIIVMKEKLEAFDNDLHLALMAYNGGNGYAQRLIDKQIYSTEYSEHIMFVANNLIAENDNG